VSPQGAAATPALAEVAERATRDAAGSLAATLVAAGAGRAGEGDGRVPEAVRAIEMLEGALRLHDELLESRPGAENGAPAPIAGGLGGAWLLGEASETAAELGDDAAGIWGEAANELVRARILALEDLYDAGRTPARYLTVAELREGGLLSLAVRLGASIAGVGGQATAAVGRYGRELGVAAEIGADVDGLRDAGGAAARRVGAGDYPLPLLYAIESDPELAGLLGKPLGAEALVPVLERVRAAGGLERAIEESRRRAAAAAGALDGLADADTLVEIAERVKPDQAEAVT
jgi:hypothetical protein